MKSSNKKAISDFLNRKYEKILGNKYVLTSIVPATKDTKEIVEVIGEFHPIVKSSLQKSIPIIKLNYLDESTDIEVSNILEKEYKSSLSDIIRSIIENSSIYYLLSIDYHLLTDNVINILKEKYVDSRFSIRIIGDYILDETMYNKLSFLDEIIVTKTKGVKLIKNCRIQETTDIYTEVKTANEKFDPIEEIYISRTLSKDELSKIVDQLNHKNNHIKRIYVRNYKPQEYQTIIENLTDLKLNKNVKINFLANPLLDRSEYYKSLCKSFYNIDIFYSTDSSLLDKMSKEPFFGVEESSSDIESTGTSSSKDYYKLLTIKENIIKDVSVNKFSPIESILYVYNYIQINNKELRELSICEENNYIGLYSYAKLLSILLRSINIESYIYNTYRCQKNICHIVDKKYKVDKILYFDITSELETNRYNKYTALSYTYFTR